VAVGQSIPGFEEEQETTIPSFHCWKKARSVPTLHPAIKQLVGKTFPTTPTVFFVNFV